MIPLRSLRPGAKFVCPWNGQRGRLVHVSPSRARVSLGTATRRFTTAAGEQVTLRTPVVTDWAPGTEVEPWTTA